jgi:chorismate mutase/prephenate dehydratase
MAIIHALNEAFSHYPQVVEPHPRVAYSGIRGSYGEEASLSYFKGVGELLPCQTFEDVFKALDTNKCDYGVLPIENSSTGSIASVYDLLSQYHYFIVGEEEVCVQHCLLAPKGSNLDTITEIYSHPQGFAQSQTYINKHPEWQCIPYYNTAISAAYVAQKNDCHLGAIASKNASKIYDLEILAENINFSQKNVTRFVIISPQLKLFNHPSRVSIAFHLPHKPGSLNEIIGVFSAFSLNLCKIESRPLLNQNWEYLFFIDFTGNISKEILTSLIPIIQEKSDYFKFLGYYPQYHDKNRSNS